MYYKRQRCDGQEIMAMVFLSCTVCLSLGACLGFLGAAFCAVASDKPQRRLNANATPVGRGWENNKALSASGLFFEGEKSPSNFEQVRGKRDASHATANRAD
jgi:hypothetical protein